MRKNNGSELVIVYYGDERGRTKRTETRARTTRREKTRKNRQKIQVRRKKEKRKT